MTRTLRASLLLSCAFLILAFASLACDGLQNIKECYPDTRRICVCRDGTQSTQSCDSQKTTWLPCTCSSSASEGTPEASTENPSDAAAEAATETTSEPPQDGGVSE